VRDVRAAGLNREVDRFVGADDPAGRNSQGKNRKTVRFDPVAVALSSAQIPASDNRGELSHASNSALSFSTQ